MYLDEQSKNKIISILKERIASLKALYIFGSYANGSATQASDIDIAYLANESFSALERFELSQELAGILHKEIDLIALGETNTVFRYQIIANSERIYSDSEEIEAFETLAYSFYLRFQEERQPILDAIYADKKILNVS